MPREFLYMRLFMAFIFVLQTGCGSGGSAGVIADVVSVVSATPSAGSTNVPVGSSVRITFDSPVDPSSANGATFSVRGPSGAVAGAFMRESDKKTMAFVPILPFSPLSTFTVNLTNGLKDVYGRRLNGNISWSFTTSKSVLDRSVTDVVNNDFFGMHIHRATTTTPWPAVPFATWRLWDAGVTWPKLEPSKGNWDFALLDKLIELAEQHNVQPLLTLGLTPTWASVRPAEKSYFAPGNAAEPANLDNWRDYVRTLATRYKGRICYYEIWNEPNLLGFYTGTVDNMVILAREAFRIIKEIDPSAVLLSPPPGSASGLAWFEEYLSKGGGNFADVISYHFYVTPNSPESHVPLANRVREIATKFNVGDKPLWNTETGWSNPKAFATDTEAAAYVARSYILNWVTGVERLYWYAWDNHLVMSLQMTKTDDATLTPAAIAYGEVQRWLVGSRVTSSEISNDNTWIIQLSRTGGYTAKIVWNPDTILKFAIPATWGILQGRDLTGAKFDLSSVIQIEIGPSPLLLENVLN